MTCLVGIEHNGVVNVYAESKEQAENIGRYSASADGCVYGVDAIAEEVDDLSHLNIGSIWMSSR